MQILLGREKNNEELYISSKKIIIQKDFFKREALDTMFSSDILLDHTPCL